MEDFAGSPNTAQPAYWTRFEASCHSYHATAAYNPDTAMFFPFSVPTGALDPGYNASAILGEGSGGWTSCGRLRFRRSSPPTGTLAPSGATGPASAGRTQQCRNRQALLTSFRTLISAQTRGGGPGSLSSVPVNCRRPVSSHSGPRLLPANATSGSTRADGDQRRNAPG